MNDDSENALQQRVAELERRVSGLEDLTHALAGYLKGYIEAVAVNGMNGRPPQIIAGSEDYTDDQLAILRAVAPNASPWPEPQKPS